MNLHLQNLVGLPPLETLEVAPYQSHQSRIELHPTKLMAIFNVNIHLYQQRHLLSTCSETDDEAGNIYFIILPKVPYLIQLHQH